MKVILTNLKMAFQLRYRILNCYIAQILLYGSESWTLNKTDIRKIRAAEMWFLRRMEKVKWTEKFINEEALNRTIQEGNIMSDISKIQISFFGHIMRKDKLEYLGVTGKIVGKRSRGRRRPLFTYHLVKWTNYDNTIEVFRKAPKRELFAANVFDKALEEEAMNLLRNVALVQNLEGVLMKAWHYPSLLAINFTKDSYGKICNKTTMGERL